MKMRFFNIFATTWLIIMLSNGYAAESVRYEVQLGDTLSSIARQVYQDAQQWRLIYEANKAVLKDEHQLKLGMILELPIQPNMAAVPASGENTVEKKSIKKPSLQTQLKQQYQAMQTENEQVQAENTLLKSQIAASDQAITTMHKQLKELIDLVDKRTVEMQDLKKALQALDKVEEKVEKK